MLGLRSGEALALQWGDIFSELEVEGMLYRLMYLRRSIWRGQVKPRLKTKKSRSAMPLPPALFDRLNRHKEASAWTGDQDFIFCRADGRPLDPDSFRRQVFHPAMDAARIERVSRGDGLQALRHSSGTILYLITRDLEKVKTFLRHTRIGATSDIYVHPGLMLSAEAVEAMASVYFDGEEVGVVQ
ncbi:MAG TPA: tyrosine-type recombinase/integrase [Blastocatellia bacterium]|nr:tyrosine-type recombinase/integrase [Blastocatellia bacterium]